MSTKGIVALVIPFIILSIVATIVMTPSIHYKKIQLKDRTALLVYTNNLRASGSNLCTVNVTGSTILLYKVTPTAVFIAPLNSTHYYTVILQIRCGNTTIIKQIHVEG